MNIKYAVLAVTWLASSCGNSSLIENRQNFRVASSESSTNSQDAIQDQNSGDATTEDKEDKKSPCQTGDMSNASIDGLTPMVNMNGQDLSLCELLQTTNTSSVMVHIVDTSCEDCLAEAVEASQYFAETSEENKSILGVAFVVAATNNSTIDQTLFDATKILFASDVDNKLWNEVAKNQNSSETSFLVHFDSSFDPSTSLGSEYQEAIDAAFTPSPPEEKPEEKPEEPQEPEIPNPIDLDWDGISFLGTPEIDIIAID